MATKEMHWTPSPMLRDYQFARPPQRSWLSLIVSMSLTRPSLAQPHWCSRTRTSPCTTSAPPASSWGENLRRPVTSSALTAGQPTPTQALTTQRESPCCGTSWPITRTSWQRWPPTLVALSSLNNFCRYTQMKEKVGDNLIDFSFTVILRLESFNLVIRFRNTSFVSILNESNIFLFSTFFSNIFQFGFNFTNTD